MDTAGHKSTILAMYERLDQGDASGLLELFDDDTVVRQYGPGPDHLGTYSGRHAVEEEILPLLTDVNHAHRTIESVVAEEDTVAVHGTLALNIGEGEEASGPFDHFFRFCEDGTLAMFVDVEPAALSAWL